MSDRMSTMRGRAEVRAEAERDEREARARFGALDVAAMPTIHVGQYANLKIDADGWRVWHSRLEVADGAEHDHGVEVERLVDGCWVEVATWEAV